jgi:hypothetical protein
MNCQFRDFATATVAAAAFAIAGAAHGATTVYAYSGSTITVTLDPGEYLLHAYGAEGGADIFSSTRGGAGAQVGGRIQLASATTLTLLVGGEGGTNPILGGGGGGGTFVMDGATPLLVAGGGGGAGGFFAPGDPGLATNSGTGGGQGLAAIGGGGGLDGTGGGLNLGPGSGLHWGGYSYVDGGFGGVGPGSSPGGFGGGGATGDTYGAGGGGYSGGYGGIFNLDQFASGILRPGGGGGGSFVATGLLDPVEIAGDNSGEGFVTIAAVPEPAVWSMLILGLGLIGGALRRRNREAALAR